MGKLKTFRGGVHPPENKELSEKIPIEYLSAPEKVIVALCQHLGVPSSPEVKKGDSVTRGQLIGSRNGFISLPSHSSVTGKVLSVENHALPHRRSGLCITIETESEEGDPVFEPWADFSAHSPEELIERIKLCGVCGMGGASFPTYVKLSPPPDKKIDILILNGVECEPYLTADDRLMLENTDDINLGMNILAYILGVKEFCIGIEANKPEAIKKLKASGADVVPLMVKYPQGAEKQLIDAVTNRKVPVGGLPMDVGVLVQNVGTAAAVAEAVRDGMPSIRRVTTVSGRGINKPGNFSTAIGTLFSGLIEKAGGYTDDAVRLISGGPMMGMAQFTDDVPVIKGTSGILALTSEELRDVAEGPCIGCAKCVDTCPMNLMPTDIARAAEYGKWEIADRLGALSCIACGSCSFVCPAGRYLIHHIKLAQDEIRANLQRVKGA